jgi:cyclophilin family peptidyl-prolyl cis-trans isomerase
MRRLTMILAVLVLAGAGLSGQRATPAPAAGPTLVIDTVKGTIEVQLFKADAPKSVDHIIALANQGFYRSQRFHRVTPTLIQFGDKLSRDMTQMQAWGVGNSNNPIGVAEISPKHKHVRGTVALANIGDPKYSDSQMYIMKAASPSLDGKYTIIGQVTKGMAVADKIEKADLIRNVTVR